MEETSEEQRPHIKMGKAAEEEEEDYGGYHTENWNNNEGYKVLNDKKET